MACISRLSNMNGVKDQGRQPEAQYAEQTETISHWHGFVFLCTLVESSSKSTQSTRQTAPANTNLRRMQANFFRSAALPWLWYRSSLAALEKPKAPVKRDLVEMAVLKSPWIRQSRVDISVST